MEMEKIKLPQPIKMYNPVIDYHNHKDEYDKAIFDVVESGQFIMGPQVKLLEEKLANFCNVNYCVTVSNGTDALMIALMSLGIGPGDEVITVPFTWISTAEVIGIIGATPVFVDIDEKTYNMDAKLLEEKITKKTKAIIPVSLYGRMANFDEITKISIKYGIPVIEDGAQSFGAEINGNKSCSCYLPTMVIGCTSFFPSKPLGAYGDGGACFTNDEMLYNKMRAIRTHGGIERFKHSYIGTNGRMNTIQAAVLLVKLKYFEQSLVDRIENAKFYNKELKKIEGIIVPEKEENERHIYGQYTLNVGEYRDELVKYLKEIGIGCGIFYPISLHTQIAFSKYGYKKGDFPITEKICNEVVSLPVYGGLTNNEIIRIIKIITDFFANK